MKQIKIAIAGSSSRTRLCAEALSQDDRFVISLVITPPAKPVGRKGTLTASALELFATANQLPILFVQKKIDQIFKQNLIQFPQPDFLLVVDFGYIIPDWLLAWPKIAPINVHPSALPRWRGSSPGQFCLLYGEKMSAVSIMMLDSQLDHGPLLASQPFTVAENWTQTEYYQHAFGKVVTALPQTLVDFAAGRITAKPQPDHSPTPQARRLERADGYIEWEAVQAALRGDDYSQKLQSELLQSARAAHASLAALLAQASQALAPWPGLWTELPTATGVKRMKLLNLTTSSQKMKDTSGSADASLTAVLELQLVQIEGKNPTSWQDAQAAIKN